MKLKPVNLISKGVLKSQLLRKFQAFNRQNRQLTKLIGLGLAAVFLLSFIPAIVVADYKFRLASIKRAIENTKIEFKKLQSQDFQLEKIKNDLTNEKNRLQQRSELLFSTSSEGKEYSDALVLLPGLLPKDLWINRLVMNDNEILISGSALNSGLIADFMNKLDEPKGFKNSRFISSEKQAIDTNTLYNFQIAAEQSWSKKKIFFGEQNLKAKK